MTDSVKKIIEEITKKTTENLSDLRYGSTSVILHVHNFRIVDVTYSVTQNIKDSNPSLNQRENISKEESYG
ncbi:hypothetical protein AGMMS50268_40170 [Spirochaetia bacterium]|nr:hypothetical protein AGMMS50268_40170 [Spirochaetia bacterium]